MTDSFMPKILFNFQVHQVKMQAPAVQYFTERNLFEKLTDNTIALCRRDNCEDADSKVRKNILNRIGNQERSRKHWTDDSQANHYTRLITKI